MDTKPHIHKPELYFSFSGKSYAEFCTLCGVRLSRYSEVVNVKSRLKETSWVIK